MGDTSRPKLDRCSPAQTSLVLIDPWWRSFCIPHPSWDSLLQECGILSSPRQRQPFRALSLWLAARFKSFTKIPKTFSRLVLRRQGCGLQRSARLGDEGRKQAPVPAQDGAAGPWGVGGHTRARILSLELKRPHFSKGPTATSAQNPEETEWTAGTGSGREAKPSMGLHPLHRSRKLCLPYHVHYLVRFRLQSCPFLN